MDTLPCHLLYEILLFIPVESLLRFRTISRQWRDIISSPKFTMDHLKRGKSSHYVILYSNSTPCITLYPHSGRDPFKLNLPIPPTTNRGGEFAIKSSCRGLLCVTFSTTSSTSIFLWNPIIRRCRKLPQVILFGLDSGEKANIALGFDPAANDFKVVIMTSARHKSNHKIKITLLSVLVKSNVERRVEDHQTEYMPEKGAVAVDGYILWLAKNLQNYSYGVLILDLAFDHLTAIPCPPDANVKKSKHDQINLSLHECGGSVWLVRFELDDMIQWNMKFIWLLSIVDGMWSDVSSRYKAAMKKSFRGWYGPLGFTSEAAIVIERSCVAGNYICKDDGVERRRVGSPLKDAPFHVLHCPSLVSPWH